MAGTLPPSPEDPQELVLHDPQLTQEPLPLYNPQPSSPTLSPEKVDDRVEKNDYAMINSPGKDVLRGTIFGGFEDNIRKSQTNQELLKDIQMKNGMLDEYAKTTPAGEADPSFVSSLFTPSKEIQPQSITELQVAKKGMMSAFYNPDTSFGTEATTGSPTLDGILAQNRGSTLLHQNMFADKLLQDYEEKYNSFSPASKALSWAGGLLPGVNQVLLHNALEPAKSWLPGNNLKEQIQKLYSSDNIQEFQSKLQATTEALWKQNPDLALYFLQQVRNGSSDSFNALTNDFVMSLLPLGTAAKGVKLGTLLATSAPARAVLGDATAAIATKFVTAFSSGFTPVKMADAIMDIRATQKLSLQMLKDDLARVGKPGSFKEVAAEVPGFLNPDTVTGGAYEYLHREEAKRLNPFLQKLSGDLIQGLLNDPKNVDRLSNAGALDQALITARESFVEQYPHLEDRINRVSFVDSSNRANVDQLNLYIGDENSNPFKGQMQAMAMLRDSGIGGAKIVRDGAGWFVQVRKPVSEIEPLVRQKLSVGTTYQDPMLMQSAFMRMLTMATGGTPLYVRSAEDLLSKQMLQDMHTAQHSASRLVEISKIASKEISKLPVLRKESREALNDFLNHQRTETNDLNPTKIGRFSRTLGEFESDWTDMHGRLPTDGETKAYFTYQYITNADYMLRNLGAFKDKWRIGVEMHNLKFYAPSTDGGHFLVKDIEGKSLPELPDHIWKNNDNWSNHAGVVVLDRNPNVKFPDGKKTSGMTNYYNTENWTRERFEKLFRPGEWKVIHLTDDGEATLKATGIKNLPPKAKINYILVRDAGATPISLKQIPHTEGGHNLYPIFGSYIKQPIISKLRGEEAGDMRHLYYGDKTLFFQALHKDAKEWAKKFDDVRIAYNEGKRSGSMSAFERLRDSTLPSDFVGTDKFEKLFTKGGYDPEMPFLATHSGTNTFDQHKLIDRYDNLKKSSDSANHLLKGRDLEFMMQKDEPLTSIVNKTGTTTTPSYGLKMASMMDPIPTMNRSIQSLVKGSVLNDLKVKAAEQFVQRYGDMLNIPATELAQNPVRHLLSPKWIDAKGEQTEKLMYAQAYQKIVSNFLHVKTPAERQATWFQQKAMQLAFGDEAKGFKAQASRWALAKMENPSGFLRGLVFDMKLGMFNPAQFFKQMNAMVHIAGVEGPVWAGKGTASAWWLMRPVVSLNSHPKIIEAVAGHAASLGWAKDDFIKATDYLRSSGWAYVGRDTANLDAFTDENILQGPFGKVREMGRIPFAKGDQLPRLAGYATAFLKWRDANPTMRFTDEIGAQLVHRADLSTGNMTAASLAQIQKGWLGVPTQFATYPFRLMEQYMGKRLTGTEKLRLFSAYSAAYGVPLGIGSVVGFWPVGDYIRKVEMSNAINPDANVVGKFFNEGGFEMMVKGITGKDTNVADTFGPNGVSFFHDIMFGDKPAYEIALGASGSMMKDSFLAIDPLADLTAKVINGQWKLAASDLVEAMRTISTVNQATRAFYAMKYGEYLGRNGIEYDNKVDAVDGMIMGLLGSNPASIRDYYDLKDLSRENAAAVGEASTKVESEWQAAIRAGDDQEAAAEHFKKAAAYGVPLTPEQRLAAIRKAGQGTVMPAAQKLWYDYAKRAGHMDAKWLNFWKEKTGDTSGN